MYRDTWRARIVCLVVACTLISVAGVTGAFAQTVDDEPGWFILSLTDDSAETPQTLLPLFDFNAADNNDSEPVMPPAYEQKEEAQNAPASDMAPLMPGNANQTDFAPPQINETDLFNQFGFVSNYYGYGGMYTGDVTQENGAAAQSDMPPDALPQGVSLWIASNLDQSSYASVGDDVALFAVVAGLSEDTHYTVTWEVDKGNGWEFLTSGTSQLTFPLTEENYHWYFRFFITVE